MIRHPVIMFGKSASEPTIYDDVHLIYSIRRPNMTTLWTNAVYQVRRSSDNALAYLFFDGDNADDTYSTSSKISTTSDTIPSATTLATWLGSDDCYVRIWYGITPDNTINTGRYAAQTNNSLQPKIATAGVLATKNGKPCIDTSGGGKYLQTSVALGILDDTDDYTIISVTHNDVAASNAVIWTTSSTAGTFSHGLCDRRSIKRCFVLRSGGASVNADLSAQVDSGNQRIQTNIRNGTNIISRYNGTLQSTTAHSNKTYTNNIFRIFANEIGGVSLNGGGQEFIMYPSDKSSGISAIETDIDTYYSIP